MENNLLRNKERSSIGDGVFDSHQIKTAVNPIKVINPPIIGVENHPNPTPFDKVRRNINRVAEDKVAPSQS